MGNPFVHIELSTGDVAKAKKFYASLFAWKLGPLGPDYTGIDVGQGTGGGMQASQPGAPPAWLPYVEVDDVTATMNKAKKLGAKIDVAYMDIGDMGAIGVMTDPTGAKIGLWARKPAAPAKKAKAPAKKKAAKNAPAKKKARTR